MVDATLDPLTNAIGQLMMLGWTLGMIMLLAPLAFASGWATAHPTVNVIVHKAAMLI